MPNFSAVVLLTRPRDAAQRFAQHLTADLPTGVRIVLSPLLKITPVSAAFDISAYSGLIFTSARAIAYAGAPHDLPVYCVGAETRRQAEAAGWSVVLHAQDADHLFTALKARNISAPLLHLCGRHRRGALAARLTDAGCHTDEVIVYDQQAEPLSEEARAYLDGSLPVIVPVFSPRTAQIFASDATGRAPLYLIGISDAALAPLQDLPAIWKSTASVPSALAIRSEIIEALRRVETQRRPL